MKRNIVSSLIGAVLGVVFMFVLIVGLALSQTNCNAVEDSDEEYKQVKYTSAISEHDCFVCGEDRDPLMAHYWKEDNIGILNLNTFDVMYIPINRYEINGEQITEPTGVLESSWKTCGTSNLHAWTDPDRGYSHIDIPDVSWKIKKTSIQHKLCQNCIDQINDTCIWGKPAEYAVVSFKDKMIRPIVDSNPWFVFGNYSVDSEINNNILNLKIDYCPPRNFLEASS